MPAELAPDSSFGNCTRFEFPFNSPKKSASDAFSAIRAGLEEISEATLLFLSHIEAIHWRFEGGAKVSLLRVPHSEYHIETLKESEGKAIESSHFLRFTKPVEGLERQYAAIAFDLQALPNVSSFDSNKPLSKQFRIVPAVPGRVAVFFTATKETSGLRFHLHAPFVPELSRASIKDTPLNMPLFRELAELSARSLFTIRDLGLLTADFLGAPWKGASSQWVRIPRSNCRFRLVAARAIYGGNDVGRSTLVSKGRLGRFSRPYRPERERTLSRPRKEQRGSRPCREKGKADDGREEKRQAHRTVSAGVVASACMEEGRRGNTGSPVGGVHAPTGTP